MERVRGRRTTTLFSPDNHILRDLGPTLVDLNRMRGAKDADDVWQALERAILGLKHGLTGVNVIERDGRDVAVVQRRGMDLPLRDLSDGYQAMLVIILDLVIRYVYLSPLEEPMRRAATVVIDEVDLHLHPRWQRRVVGQLTKLFPETQFILTTHSPAVVQGAIDFGHQVLVLRQNKEGVSSVVPLSDQARHDLEGAQLGSVLVDKHLFGVVSRYSPRYGLVEQQVRNRGCPESCRN
jgi:predicted ATP-binding protein involved in virulence